VENGIGAVDNPELLNPEATYELLERYGIPLIPQHVVYSPEPDDAVRAAEVFGYPVVLKALAPSLVHKSDVGGVRMNLHDDHQVERAALAIQERVPDLTGYVLQSQAPGGHELIIGCKRDPAFGPVVLVGLGGIWTELLDDVSVRIAPIDLDDAREMIDSLRGSRLLYGYRGARAADVDELAQILVNVSRLIVENPEVAELDLNPVIAGAEVVAVDTRVFRDDSALARRGGSPSVEEAVAGVGNILRPERIAVIGASNDRAKPGGRLFSYLLKHGFKGTLYPVNPGSDEIMGHRSYSTTADLPEIPDLACIMLPAESVPGVVRECGEKGIKSAIVYTSGFGEIGKDGQRLQSELLDAAREYAVRLCGPNTAGVDNASASI
jgi:acetate---CoA ligase (ADP-forming)